MALAGRFHGGKLRLVELWAIDVSPVVSRGIHREAGRHGAIGTNDHVVLAGAAVPIRETELAVRLLDNPWHRGQQLGLMAIPLCSITIPAVFLQIESRGHAHERLDLL